MIARKKRRMLMIVIPLIVVLIILGIILAIYLNTDMLKSNKTLFLKYLGKNSENIETIQEILQGTEFEQVLENTPYKKTTELKVNYTKNIGTTEESKSNPINLMKLIIEETKDKPNQYENQNIKLIKDNENKMEVEILKNENGIYGVKFPNLFKQYLLSDENNIEELKKKLGYEELNFENLELDFNIFNNIKFSEEEIQNLKERYFELFVQETDKTNFEAQKNQTIVINGKNINANEYSLKLTKEQLNNAYIRILENIKEDEVVLGKIDNIQNAMKQFLNGKEIKEEIIKEIDEKIDEIRKNNIGNEETKIIVYENQGKTVNTTIQGPDYEINIDCISEEVGQFIELSTTKNKEKAYSISLLGNNDEKSITIQKDKEKITFEENKKVDNDTLNKNIVLRYEDEGNKVEATATQKSQKVDQVTKNLDENTINLDELTEEQLNAIMERVTEAVTNRMNVIKEEIKQEDIEEVLIAVGIIKDYKQVEGKEVTQTQRNRYNAKYELLQAEKVSTDETLRTLEILRPDLNQLEIVSNTELKLKISRNQGDEEQADKLKEFLEKDRNRTYNIKVQYDENGLVESILLQIIVEE